MAKKPPRIITTGDVITRLHNNSQKAGSQSAYAKEIGVSNAYLSDVLNGRREPGFKILEALGLSRIVEYVEVGK